MFILSIFLPCLTIFPSMTTTNVLQNLENNQIWEDPTNIEFVFFCQHRVYSILCQNSILEIN